jgi:hypothetical protein
MDADFLVIDLDLIDDRAQIKTIVSEGVAPPRSVYSFARMPNLPAPAPQ